MSIPECLSPVDKNQFPICWKHSFVSWNCINGMEILMRWHRNGNNFIDLYIFVQNFNVNLHNIKDWTAKIYSGQKIDKNRWLKPFSERLTENQCWWREQRLDEMGMTNVGGTVLNVPPNNGFKMDQQSGGVNRKWL